MQWSELLAFLGSVAAAASGFGGKREAQAYASLVRQRVEAEERTGAFESFGQLIQSTPDGPTYIPIQTNNTSGCRPRFVAPALPPPWPRAGALAASDAASPPQAAAPLPSRPLLAHA